MKRDLICYLRLLGDLLPTPIRNSWVLFKILQIIFRYPSSLFDFRQRYQDGKIKDLSIFYLSSSTNYLKKISKITDINSFHLKIICLYFKKKNPQSILDVGCGSGFLIEKLKHLSDCAKYTGIDYQLPFFCQNSQKVSFIEGDILTVLKTFPDKSYEFVSCTHVIEHLSNPFEVVRELRRVCSKYLIVICPLEKRFKWGLNYHINFYTTKNIFLNFMKKGLGIDSLEKTHYELFVRLGDALYIEQKAI